MRSNRLSGRQYQISVESVISVFVVPTEFFSNTDYKDFHGCYCFEKNYPFNPFNPCSFYQQSSFRTRIIRMFTDIIVLRYVILLEKSNPFNPLYPCSP